MPDIADLAADRITYREGQRLTASDLQDDRNGRARLRRLHVRHLHETWGIAIGFDVQAASDEAVAVGPGYALDIAARDLALSTSLAVPVPAVAGPELFVLVATYMPDCAFPTTAAGAAVCLDAPVHPRRERPALALRTIAELEIGPMVPLCHVVVQNQKIAGTVQTRIRRYARRMVRPYVAGGVTDADSNLWTRFWHNNLWYGMSQRVDTSEAGFTATPQYVAQLVPVQPSPVNRTTTEVEQALAGAHGHIRETARDSFVFEAVVIERFIPDLLRSWAIRWVGVQPMAGCPPVLNLKNLFTRAGLFFPIRVP
jgi:hypothetical protein